MRKSVAIPMTTRSLLGAALLALACSAGTALPARAAEPVDAAPWQAELVKQAQADFGSFYAYRSGPLWIAHDGRPNAAAGALLDLIRTAHFDGIDPALLNYGELAAAIGALGQDPSPDARARAELALSQTFVTYVTSLRNTTDNGMLYEHDLLRPYTPEVYTTLENAANTPSLEDYVRGLRWMHPLYSQLRQAVMADGGVDASTAQVARANLERLRALPSSPGKRYVLIDAASARLWMYEGDQVVDSMKVVVGTAETPTPIMAGYIRYAVFNPYWNVPPELLRKNIAPRARAQGQTYLNRGGYQVVSEWSADAEVLPSAGIDWRAVETGQLDIKVRQLPGGANAMGTVKYEFPNPEGIFLHDTPDKSLMLKDVRQLSNGCIRLEDAARFGRWLLEGALPATSNRPEQKTDLAVPVPIYVTYITAQPAGTGLAVGPDPYSYDARGQRGLARAEDPPRRSEL
jgi:L,D-transpeptidase YcbB